MIIQPQNNIKPTTTRPELEATQTAYGSIPNLYLGMSNSASMLKLYLCFNKTLAKFGDLSPIEQQVAYLTFSVENNCIYCVSAHSALALLAKMPKEILIELRERRPLSDPKLNAVKTLSLAIQRQQGRVSKEQLDVFLSAGFNHSQVFEIITILAQITMSNYFNHIAETPLDEMFKPVAWEGY